MSDRPVTRESDLPPFTLKQLAWLRGTFQPPPTPQSTADETLPSLGSTASTVTTPAVASVVSGEYC